MINDIKARLVSRKFFVALASALVLFSTGNYGEGTLVVVSYLLGQGAVDALAERNKAA